MAQDSQPTKKIRISSRSDMISNLPSDIIQNILSCLPIQEAVKTSLLSKKWRFKWRFLPHLVFDDVFYQTSIKSSTPQPNITNFFLNIYKVLLLHSGPILNFTFHVPLSQSYPEIDQLMLYLTEKNVHEFSFDFGKSIYGYHRLPSFMFSYVTLRCLTLSSCLFRVPLAFQGFVHLISLKFQLVDFNNNVSETFISKCPLLETLSFKECSNIGHLDIDIPYLKFFHFSGYLLSICFNKTSQHLTTVIINGYLSGLDTSGTIKLFDGLPAVEHLYLGFRFLASVTVGTIPRKLSLGCLRVLELPRVYFGWEEFIISILWLIVSSPNLEKLEIASVSTDEEVAPFAPVLVRVEHMLDNAVKKLRVVKMKLSDIKQVKPELEFIQFLLAEAVVLEKMFIQPADGTASEEGFKILKEISRFERSSKKAQLLFLDPEDAGEISSDESEG